MSVSLVYAPEQRRTGFKSIYTSETICQVRELFPSMEIKSSNRSIVETLAFAGEYKKFWQEVLVAIDKYGKITLSTET